MKRIIVGILLGWIVAGSGVPLCGQTPTTDYVVRSPSVEVRGGRSSIFPVTGYLRQGQSFKAQREENGWLAISPPAGSSSWVTERVLDPQPMRGQRTICVLLADDAPILLGTPNTPQPHPHQVGTAKRGTMVVVLGERAVSDALGEKTTWWRIQPTTSEVRWVSKDAVLGMANQLAGGRGQESGVRSQNNVAGQPVARPSYTPVQPPPPPVSS